MLEVRDWVTIAVALLVLLGTYLTVRATKGKTQADAKTAFDNRVDEKMASYADRLEKRLEAAEKKADDAKKRADELEDRVEHLEAAQEASGRREKLLYKYTSALRDHILSGKQPPPPRIPDELTEWYSSFETGGTGISR